MDACPELKKVKFGQLHYLSLVKLTQINQMFPQMSDDNLKSSC